MVSSNGLPALWLPDSASVNELAELAPTVRLSEVPVTATWVAAGFVIWVLDSMLIAAPVLGALTVKAILWASKSVRLTALAPVATPLTKVTAEPLTYGKLTG